MSQAVRASEPHVELGREEIVSEVPELELESEEFLEADATSEHGDSENEYGEYGTGMTGNVAVSSDCEEPESVVNTVDIETTSDSSPAAETDHEETTKKPRPVRRKKKEPKANTRRVKRGRVTKRTSRKKTKTAPLSIKIKVGRKERQPLQAQLKKEKIRKANRYLRKGLDDPTSAPEVADIPVKERLRRGLEDLSSGKFKTVSAAAAYWRVHAGRLYRRRDGAIPWDSRHGPAPVLTGEEEEALANWILTMSQRGFQVSASLVRDAVQIFFRKNHSPFVNGRPSYRWYYNFLSRNPRLSERKPSNLVLLCDASPTKAVVGEWFQQLKTFLSKLGVADKPRQILNYAEIDLNLNKKHDKIVPTLQPSSERPDVACLKREVVVGMCACANGRILPPFIIYRGLKHMPQQWDPLEGAPKGSGAFIIKKDGKKQEAFSYWMEHHLLKNIGKQRPVVLLLSCNHNEISYKSYVTASENGVYLFRIPSKATSFLEPLDVRGEAAEGPLRSAWITKWVTENRSVTVNFSNIASVINWAWKDAENSEAIHTCFIQSGIYPLDREMVDDDHLQDGNLDFLDKNAPEIDVPIPAHVLESDHPTADTNPNIAELVFHKLDEKLDKTTRETYQACIKSGLDLEETPLFSVWKKLYLEAYQSDSKASPRTGKGKHSKRTNKKQSPRGKSSSKYKDDEVFCPVCDEQYGKDGGEDWIGCDGQCQSWYHVNCLPPEVVTPALLEDKEMVCPDCVNSSQR